MKNSLRSSMCSHFPRYSLLLLWGWMVSGQLPGQVQNFQPGAVVVKGDTLEGYVNVRADVQMTAEVEFRPALTGQTTTYLPHQLDGYLLREPAARFRPLTHHFSVNNTIPEKRPVFGREIFGGPRLSLYRVNRPADEYNYKYAKLPDAVYYLYVAARDTFLKLEVQERLLYATKFRVFEAYKGVLNYELRDWPRAEARVSKTEFNDDDLAEVLAAYHEYHEEGETLRRYENTNLKRHVVLLSAGALPVAFPQQLDYNFGYLLEGVYEFQNPATTYPYFFIGLGYLSTTYDYMGFEESGLPRQYNGLNQLRLIIGARKELLRTRSSFALYASAAALTGNIRYPDEREMRTVTVDADGNPVITSSSTDNTLVYKRSLSYRIGLGAQYKRLLFDVNLERLRYSFRISDFTLVGRVSYQLFGRQP